MGGGFLYCSMTLWIFSHKTFGSSTLGICRVTKDIHIKEGTTNYSQLFRPPQRRQDPPSIPSKNIGQRVKTTSDHLEWLRSRKETRLYRPRSSPIPVPVKNRRKEDLRFLLRMALGEGGREEAFPVSRDSAIQLAHVILDTKNRVPPQSDRLGFSRLEWEKR